MADLSQQLQDYLARPGYEPTSPKRLAKKLGITKKKQRVEFDKALQDLIDAGGALVDEQGQVRSRKTVGLFAGIIRRISSGAGFFIPHEPLPNLPPGDLYVSPEDMHDAHSGDEVLVRVLRRRGFGGRRCGRVEEVVLRASMQFVGTYITRDGQGYVQVDGKTFAEPIHVGDPGAKGVQPNDKVVIEMVRFPTHFAAGEAVLTEVLGPRGQPGIDTLAIIREMGLPDEFPEEVLQAARDQVDAFDEADFGDRRDLTGDLIVTVDPVDARDFDDAISLTRSGDGHWHLGVHIADVAHFVPSGSPLDQEAQKRGNSVYLPQRVIPMLPEILSNGLASLQQKQIRYTKSVLVEFSPEGIPVHTEFVNSVIQVTRRFAYEEVMPIVNEPDRFRTRVSAKIREQLARMHELSRILRRRRFESGALELHLAEVKLDFNKDGAVTGAHEAQHDDSHEIIEEFMLAANVAVASKLFDLGVPFLRRVHADPDFEKLRGFSVFVEALGFKLERFQSRRDLQDLLDRAHGTPAEHAINYALLRSLKQAEYTGDEAGHYALAEEHYCHFTSPIRRYPDLLVHRLVGQLAAGKSKPRGPSAEDLIKLGRQCSMTERRAERAERELVKVKLLTLMQEKVGEELDAIVTGVEGFGVFCRGIELPVEGLVHISQLSADDIFDHDPATVSLVGRRSGRRYRLGDAVRVRVVHVDVERRSLDFLIVSGGTQLDEEDRRRRSRNGPPASSGSRGPRSSGKKSSGKGNSKRSGAPRKKKGNGRR